MLSKWFTKVLPVWLMMSLALAACAPAATPAPTSVPPAATAPASTATTAPAAEPTVTALPTPEPITLKDGLGRTVTLAAPAQRIITLAPSNTEILFALGAGAQMVGRDELSDYPAEAASVASIGSLFGQINTEAIVALQPDLVLAAEINSPEHVQALEDIGLTVYLLANPKDFDGLYQNLLVVGQLTGREAEAQTLVEGLKTRVAAVVDQLYGLTDRPKVFYELDATDPTKPFTVGAGTFMDVLIQMAGGENIGAALDSPYPQISAEELVQQNPDIILLGDAAYGTTPESVKGRAGWEAIAAVQTGNIVAFDDNLASRPGPRLVSGLETLAKLLHPELFK
jgi:iron complex transport system substrate-binding protein